MAFPGAPFGRFVLASRLSSPFRARLIRQPGRLPGTRHHADGSLPGAGILTRCASATPFGLALAPD